MTTNRWMIDTNDAVLLLIDHQSGLFQLVRDMEYSELRNNVITLAKVAKIAKIPTITTASVPEGPNGPIIPEIHQNNPDAVHVPRSGPINAWDHRPFVEAIEQTNRKTLLIAGTLTSKPVSHAPRSRPSMFVAAERALALPRFKRAPSQRPRGIHGAP